MSNDYVTDNPITPGSIFGDLTVLHKSRTERPEYVRYRCRCACGKICTVNAKRLLSDKPALLLCSHRSEVVPEEAQPISAVHPGSQSTLNLEIIWQEIIECCRNPKCDAYPQYGGRGITVCDEWFTFVGFANWAKVNGYESGMFLARTDLDQAYLPDNCYWTLLLSAGHAKRTRDEPIRYAAFDMEMTINDWAADSRCAVSEITLRTRLTRGWDVERALTTPAHPKGLNPSGYTVTNIPVGATFGRLSVVGAYVNRRFPSGGLSYLYPCTCSCGNPEVQLVATDNLRNGLAQSCGCFRRDAHRAYIARPQQQPPRELNSNSRLYHQWRDIRSACIHPANATFHLYGARGINMDVQWQSDFLIFRDWATTNGYTDSLFLARRDRKGNFTPENCYWTSRPTRVDETRRRYVAFGEEKTFAEWGDDSRCRVTKKVLSVRLHIGWDMEQALTTPVRIAFEEQMFTAVGEEKTLTEWLQDSRCQVSTARQVYKRVHEMHWTFERAILTPSQKKSNDRS